MGSVFGAWAGGVSRHCTGPVAEPMAVGERGDAWWEGGIPVGVLYRPAQQHARRRRAVAVGGIGGHRGLAGQEADQRDTLIPNPHPQTPYWQNGPKRPVLKHGPRSLTLLRAFGWQTRDAQ